MRRRLIQFHTALAAFFLPVGIMFLVTGALYTVGIKGGYHTETRTIQLTEPLPAELSKLVAIVEQQPGVDPPSGAAQVKQSGGSYSLDWTGSTQDLSLTPTADPLVAELTIKDTTLYRRFVQLHKAKGGPLFKGLAVAWAVGLLLLFASGVALALAIKSYRPLTLISMGLGLLTFVVFAFAS